MGNTTVALKRLAKSLLRSAGIQATRVSPYTNDDVALDAMLKAFDVDLLLDIGANIGQYAKERLASGYKGLIVSFEPISAAREVLLKEAQLYPNWVVADRCAIGDRRAVVEIHVSDNSEASSVLTPTASHLQHAPQAVSVSRELVDLRTLDDVAATFLERSKTPFLKIDVQGFEHKVLAGAAETVSRSVGLQVELSFVKMYDDQRLFPEMTSIIDALGFTLCRMIPVTVDKQTGKWLQADGVFFRRENC